jgi:hypothetical protein
MLDFGMFGQSDLGLDFARVGIKDVAKAAGTSLDSFAPYEMADLTHGSRSSNFLKRQGNLQHLRYFGSIFAVFQGWVTRWASAPDEFSFTNG